MNVADFIVEFLINKGISDVFGYPGGMVTNLMEALRIRSSKIKAHVAYHEQAAAFAACGYAQVSGKPGVAYATSGPGATNLVTGICNAYFDSIPCIFITGQVNANESNRGYGMRQRGFQETDIVSMVSPVTKYAVRVEDIARISNYLEHAYEVAVTDRPGPVLLDIPMDIMRAEVSFCTMGCRTDVCKKQSRENDLLKRIRNVIRCAERPVLLFGNGVKVAHCEEKARRVATELSIPIVTSMLAVDLFGYSQNYFGFIGAYGARTANFVIAKADLVISVGSRLDVRQVGALRRNFAPNAKLIRFDIDVQELAYPVHDNEISIQATIEEALSLLLIVGRNEIQDYSKWFSVCCQIQEKMKGVDGQYPNWVVKKISDAAKHITTVTTDVGQNQVWVAQSFRCRENQKILFTGGHGAMGFALPAAIGACYGIGGKVVLCITGDGGMQMNIQEMQWIARERLPIKIVVMNNRALGMIRYYQEMYLNGKYFQTKKEGGYTAPDFCRIAEAYGIASCKITDLEQLHWNIFLGETPLLVEVMLDEDTRVSPKLEFGKPNQDQEPLLDRDAYNEIMSL